MDNCAVYLLNGAKELVPLGDIGEMYVVGAHVASGYVNNREKDRFTANNIQPNRKGLLTSQTFQNHPILLFIYFFFYLEKYEQWGKCDLLIKTGVFGIFVMKSMIIEFLFQALASF